MLHPEDLILALSIGFFGSLHCLGMCGPIALAIPRLKHSLVGTLASLVLYNGGRTVTYGALGVVVGMVGRGAAWFHLQQLLSIVLGSLLVIVVLFPMVSVGHRITAITAGFSGRLTSSFSRWMKRGTVVSLTITGLLNGLLPCGLVYVGLAGGMNTNDPITGGLFMVAFGLGTIPMMAGIALLKGNDLNGFRAVLRKALPYFTVFVGLLLIIRGLGLDIPYLSPAAPGTDGVIECLVPYHDH